jgi:hypothetical protein
MGVGDQKNLPVNVLVPQALGGGWEDIHPLPLAHPPLEIHPLLFVHLVFHEASRFVFHEASPANKIMKLNNFAEGNKSK